MSQWRHTPAKLNLFLEILERRPDGFHELETVMISVSLFDSVKVEVAPSSELDIKIRTSSFAQHTATNLPRLNGSQRSAELAQSSDSSGLQESVSYSHFSSDPLPGTDQGDQIPTDSNNLAVQALELLRSEEQSNSPPGGTDFGASIELVKRIPSQAGLGGASSDAAIALQLANQAWGLNLPNSKLAELAARLGSDVPFFLTGGAAVCRGRGEQIENTQFKFNFPIVLVKPPVGLSTPDVYRKCKVPSDPISAEAMLSALKEGDPHRVGNALHNRLTAAAKQLTPWIGRLADMFDSSPCLGHGMSGSGSSYFAIFQNSNQAHAMANFLNSPTAELMKADWESVDWPGLLGRSLAEKDQHDENIGQVSSNQIRTSDVPGQDRELLDRATGRHGVRAYVVRPVPAWH